MAAADIQILTIVLPNPQYDNAKSVRIISSTLSYYLQLNNNFQTLCSNNPNNFDAIEGLFYVPNGTPESACNSTYASLIPSNVTTTASFPSNQNYPLVALFPWTSATCVQEFLNVARNDGVRAAITYQPNMDSPPSPTDGSWNLPGYTSWRSSSQFPIYAVSASTAGQWMTELSLYSGSMAAAPNGAILVTNYIPQDFPRLFARVDVQGGGSVPSLWIFLIIVLAVLLAVVIVASIIMHFIQRRQRTNLQRRLERGEVDLEALGIKKMNVPQEQIDAMPKYVFTADPDIPATAASPTDKETSVSGNHHPSFSQTTCPICIDDFVPNETTVRELPCKHIFHPECIDLFLRDSSSLCPLCKTSALPPGFCHIKVTNLMVRRERLIRRMRERRRQSIDAAALRVSTSGNPSTRAQAATLWFQRQLRRGAGGSGVTAPPYVLEADRLRSGLTTGAADIELAHTPATNTRTVPGARRQTIAVPPEIAAQGSAARRAWRRERVARQQEEAYNQQAETARQVDEGRPLWRRAVSRIVPGFA